VHSNQIIFSPTKGGELVMYEFTDFKKIDMHSHIGTWGNPFNFSGDINLVIDLMDKWWGEILANSHKDKLSINYTIWKHHLSDFINVVQTSDFPQRYHYRITYTDEYKKESTSA
jgi:hypothetical protein